MLFVAGRSRAELVDEQVAVVRAEPDGLDYAGAHGQGPAGAVKSRKVEAGARTGAYGLAVVREDPIPAVHREREQRPGGRREVQRLRGAAVERLVEQPHAGEGCPD